MPIWISDKIYKQMKLEYMEQVEALYRTIKGEIDYQLANDLYLNIQEYINNLLSMDEWTTDYFRSIQVLMCSNNAHAEFENIIKGERYDMFPWSDFAHAAIYADLMQMFSDNDVDLNQIRDRFDEIYESAE